jgi:RNA polymerase sigma factor (TIGR02999 family)
MTSEKRPAKPATVDLLLDEQRAAAERVELLLPELYAELRAAARACLRGERAGHTLDATALVHEAYLRLVGPREIPWANRAHFFAAAAQAMRRILVDHARAKAAARRGGAEAKRAAIELTTLPDPSSAEESAGFLLLDAALARLETVDADAAAVVRLRYFAGLSVEETAAALSSSPATVKRHWTFARGWLKDAIEHESS